MNDKSRFARQAESASKLMFRFAITPLMGILFLHACVGQDKDFKQALYQRGLERLKLRAKNDRNDLKNAFESAASIDPENLLNEFVSEFKISDSDAFLFAADDFESLPNFKLIVRYFPQDKFTRQHRDALAELSFIMGTRNEDYSSLLQVCQNLLVTRDFEDDFPEAIDGGKKEVVSNEDIRKRRTELLQFAFQLGRLQDEKTLESLQHFQRGIIDPKMKKYLHAVWLVNVGSKVLTGAEQLNEINQIKSKDFAIRVLVDLLKKYDEAQLQSMVGDSLVSKMLRLYFDPDRDPNEADSFLFELEERCTRTAFLTRAFQKASPRQLIAIAKRSKRYQNELDILELMTSANRKKINRAEDRNNLGKSLISSSLRAGNLDDAKTIAKQLSLELSSQSIFDFSIEQGDIKAAKKIVDSSPKKSLRNMSILASVLLSEGRGAEAESYVSQLEKDFKRQLENQPMENRAKWILEFALTSGWQTRNVSIKELPIERAILQEFEHFIDSPRINESISRSVDSFTPPTPASRRLLLKMMKMLPESKRITTMFEINQLANAILVAPEESYERLTTKAIELTNKSAGREKSERASRLAYSFATVGNKEGVNKLLEEIPKAEDQAWALFQCAKVFPPRRPSIGKYYSRRAAGGLF